MNKNYISFKILKVTLLMLFFISTISQAQSIVGKTFEGETYQTCAKMKGGGCSSYGYVTLHFNKDSVNVTRHSKKDCWLDDKHTINIFKEDKIDTYKWTKRNNTIHIKSFKDFEEFMWQENKLLIWKDGRKIEFLPIK